MKLKNTEIWEAIQCLSEVDETGKLGYACARNLRKLLAEGKEYMDVRDNLLKEYGQDQGAGKYSIPAESVKEFSERMEEFGNIEHEVDVMQVEEEVFYSGNLTSRQMFTLAFMVKEA